MYKHDPITLLNLTPDTIRVYQPETPDIITDPRFGLLAELAPDGPTPELVLNLRDVDGLVPAGPVQIPVMVMGISPTAKLPRVPVRRAVRGGPTPPGP